MVALGDENHQNIGKDQHRVKIMGKVRVFLSGNGEESTVCSHKYEKAQEDERYAFLGRHEHKNIVFIDPVIACF